MNRKKKYEHETLVTNGKDTWCTACGKEWNSLNDEKIGLENALAEAPRGLIGLADKLFQKMSDIRFVYHDADKELPACMRIILNESLCLWFYPKDGTWQYDGWESGDYREDWNDQNLVPKGKLP